MMDTWWNDFVGIAYRPGGSDETGCDCWGLVRLVYRRHFGIDLPGVVLDVTPGQTPEAAAIAPVLDLARDSFWERVSVPQPGDVAVFRVKGHDSHVGLVTTPGYMLHVREGHEAVIEAYDRRFWKNSFRGVYRWKGMEVLKHLSNPDCVTLIGKPSPFAPRITKVLAAGATLADIVNAICDEADIPAPMRKKGVAFVDHEQIPFEQWGDYVPKRGSVVFFRMFPGGGNTGKMIAGIALVVAAVALSVWTAGSSLTFAPKFGLMLLSMGLNMGGMYLINSSIQKAAPKATDVQEQKFLGGGSNRLPKYGVIPQVLGKGRMTLDYLAEPYTERADQYTNYLRAAYTAGYGPVEISDVRNGDTPLGKYKDIEYEIYRGDGGDQKPAIFTRNAHEDTPNVTLKKNQWNYRRTEDNVDQIQIVLHWPNGLWYKTSKGKSNHITSAGNVRWRSLPDGKWNDLQATIASQSFTLQPCSPVIDSTLVYDENGELDTDDFWLATYGVPKKLVSEEVELELYRWHTFAFNTETGNIVVHRGTATDSKSKEPSERLLKLLRQSKQLWNSDNIVGRLAPVGDNEELLAYVCVKGDEIVDVQNKRDSVSVEGCDITTDGLTVHFSEGLRTAAGENSWSISYSSRTWAFTKQFTFKVPRGQYEVGVRLTSADDDDVQNWKGSAGLTVVWQTLRTYTNGTPFKPRKPLAWLEMRVKATDQLSGTLDLVNAKVASVVLDYDYKTKTWVKRASSNPASLFRHVLQGPGMPEEHAVPDERLDLATLERWHNYCRKNGFTYFKVVGADSGLNVYDLLVEIAAAGRAKPLLRVDAGGLWTVLIDELKTQVTQLFTEHNTWGWTWTKSAVEPPHAVRATFVDKNKGYEENTVTVYADGYSSANATKYENWGVEFFEGITEVENIQRSVRRALAYAIMRCEHLTFYTAQEHLVSEIGDLVMCENSFVQWGLGSGWVEETIMENGKAVGLRLSSEVTLYPGQEYGLRVRHAAERGASRRYDLKAVEKAGQFDVVNFAKPLSKGWPEEGDLFQFGYRERESHQCIIESIKPEANGIAQVTVCDYAPELIEIDDIPIPTYVSDISTPQALPSSYIGSAPIFELAYSDERALVMEADGSLRDRIAVQWKNPATLERHATHVQIRWAEYSEEGDRGSWILGEMVSLSSGTAFCSPVEEGALYRIEARYVSDSGVVGPWALMQDNHKVLGSSLPPPDVENVKAFASNPEGVKLTWDAVDVPDLSHYEVSGAATAIVNGTTVTLQLRKCVGDLTFAVRAVDTVGNKSELAASAIVPVEAPAAPELAYVVKPSQGALLTWPSCETTWSIGSYLVEEDGGVAQNVTETQYSIPPRKAGTYTFYVTAMDIFGNQSSVASRDIVIEKPDAPKPVVKIDGRQLVVSWEEVTAPFAIDVYEVRTQKDKLLGKVKGTEIRFEAPAAGVHGYKVRARDIAGNVGNWGECTKELTVPKAPAVSVAVGGDDLARGADRIDLTWTMPASDLPVVAFDVVRQWNETLPNDVTKPREEDLGRVDVQALTLPPVPVGTYDYLVRAVDSAGNTGPWGADSLDSKAPGKVTFQSCGAVDNNVMLYYTAPDTVFWRVKEYLIEDIEGVYSAEVGRADVNFFARIENEAGKYTYGVTPVDVAGNLGTRSTVIINVTQPPDFVLYYDVDSVFGGEKTSMILDGRGHMLGPVPSETWRENIARASARVGVSADVLTWQAKADGNMGYYISPAEGVGRYVETVDVGAIIASSKIMVTVSQTTLEGAPSMTCKIEVSEKGDVWRTAMLDGLEVYEKNFRFIRLTFEWSGGLVRVGDIHIRCDVKRRTDFGKAYCSASDNGEGWVSQQATPMLTGTWVPFNVDFVDIESLPRPNVVNDSSEGGLTAYTVFEDVHKPAGFRVFVLDKNGNRASATVDWAAYGV